MQNRQKLNALITKLTGRLNNYPDKSNDTDRNKLLSESRFKNIQTLRQKLMDLLDNKAEVDITDYKLNEIVREINTSIYSTKTENTRLSSEYRKDHISYRQNLDAGLSPMNAWFKTTWFQSEANTILEKCEGDIKVFKEKHFRKQSPDVTLNQDNLSNPETIAELPENKDQPAQRNPATSL